jgi:hypothetical protein
LCKARAVVDERPDDALFAQARAKSMSAKHSSCSALTQPYAAKAINASWIIVEARINLLTRFTIAVVATLNGTAFALHH